MSTNSKTTTVNASAKLPISKKKKGLVDASIQTLMQGSASAPVPESRGGRLQRVLEIYQGIKPLLEALGGARLLPKKWRNAVVMFTQALEALSITSAPDDVASDFKMGRDL